jgi:cbb3-type cytochrome oxidase subunit 3
MLNFINFFIEEALYKPIVLIEATLRLSTSSFICFLINFLYLFFVMFILVVVFCSIMSDKYKNSILITILKVPMAFIASYISFIVLSIPQMLYVYNDSFGKSQLSFWLSLIIYILLVAIVFYIVPTDNKENYDFSKVEILAIFKHDAKVTTKSNSTTSFIPTGDTLLPITTYDTEKHIDPFYFGLFCKIMKSNGEAAYEILAYENDNIELSQGQVISIDTENIKNANLGDNRIKFKFTDFNYIEEEINE